MTGARSRSKRGAGADASAAARGRRRHRSRRLRGRRGAAHVADRRGHEKRERARHPHEQARRAPDRRARSGRRGAAPTRTSDRAPGPRTRAIAASARVLQVAGEQVQGHRHAGQCGRLGHGAPPATRRGAGGEKRGVLDLVPRRRPQRELVGRGHVPAPHGCRPSRRSPVARMRRARGRDASPPARRETDRVLRGRTRAAGRAGAADHGRAEQEQRRRDDHQHEVLRHVRRQQQPEKASSGEATATQKDARPPRNAARRQARKAARPQPRESLRHPRR